MSVGQWRALLGLVPMWGVAAPLICLPIRGYSAFQWIGVLCPAPGRAASGWSRFQSRLPPATSTSATQTTIEDDGDAGEADLPGVLSSIQIHDGPPMTGRDRTPGDHPEPRHPHVGGHRAGRPPRYRDERRRRPVRMGAGLTETHRGRVRQQPDRRGRDLVRTIPDDGTERAEWVRQHARPDEPEVSARVHAQLESIDRRRGRAPRGLRYRGRSRGRHHQGRQARWARRDGSRTHPVLGVLAEVEARLTGCDRLHAGRTGSTAPSSPVAIRTGFEPGDAPALADAVDPPPR